MRARREAIRRGRAGFMGTPLEGFWGWWFFAFDVDEFIGD